MSYNSISRLERSKWLDPSTVVTHDPRRVPAPAIEKGPSCIRVLKGGRVFSATGEAVRDATVVLVRNRIEKILPPDSFDWPQDA